MKVNITKEEEKRYVELQLIALSFARKGETKELEKMIKAGISVNLQSNKGDTLLMLASYNGNYETVEMLIFYNSDLNQANQRGQTPLDGVCFKGYLDIVKLLVKNKACIKTRTIVYASIFGNKDIVKYLKLQNKKVSFSIKSLEIFSFFSSFIKTFLIKNKIKS